ncbi:hypothetical protein C8Q70DRAFT_1099302 [Cubamyces menziesii]|nr:hypothetical protein C8Q70DRAFT_1099302 [Cubamyces menziesii]
MAAFALICYEYLITLDREVALIWGRKFTGATVLFVLNRYLALFKYPIYIADLIPISDKVRVQLCNITNILGKVLEILPYAVWTSFSTLRIYAICQQSWKIALLVALPASVPLATNIYLYSQTFAANYPQPIGCVWLNTVPHHIYSSTVLIFTRSSVITADVLVLLITWWKTYDIRRLAAQTDVKVSLTSLIVRDGTIYFLVLLYMNTIHIVLSLTGRFTFTITFEEPLTTILVSRFLLNLREVNEMRGAGDSTDYDMSRPSFVQPLGDITPPDEQPSLVSSFIAPLGAPLAHTSFLANEEQSEGVRSNGHGADDTELQDPSEGRQETTHMT